MKFGGSSVADSIRISAVADIVAAASEREPVQLVFSAMKGVTDQLLNAAEMAASGREEAQNECSDIRERHLAVLKKLTPEAPETDPPHAGERAGSAAGEAVVLLCSELSELLHGVYLVRECSPRTRDLIVSHGELLNCNVITAVLQVRGVNARMLDAREIIRTDTTHGSASVDFEATYRLISEALGRMAAENAVPVITGFIASDEDGVTTTLGRNGSDYTASLVGTAMDADAIEIWTDVDGVYSADPRFVDSARVLDAVSYREAMELSYFGAEVIHPYTMLPAVEKGIPLLIRNTMNPDAPGTVIGTAGSSTAGLVTGIASIESVALLNVEGGGMVGLPGIAGRIFGTLADARINVIMISQASSEHSICFIVREGQARAARLALERELELEIHQKKIQRIQLETDLEIVAVIGENMRGRPGISGRLFSALGAARVNVLAIAQGSTEMNISFVVSRKDRKKTLNAVHDAFFLEEES